MAKTFRCRLVTPSASLLDEQVEHAQVPMHDGLMGFLPGRGPILSQLGAGELTVEFSEHRDAKTGQLVPGGERTFVVDGGFVRMSGTELTVLAEHAVPSEALTVSEADAELKAALARTPTAKAGDERALQAERIARQQAAARAKLAAAKHRATRGV